jgi:parallel beta-helix repeat protein
MPVYDGKILYVGGDGPGNYTLIQFAIQEASPGDTVFVYPGTYRQNTIYINKSIRLLGADPGTTFLQNRRHLFFISLFPIIDISGDGVTVSGFTIQNILKDVTSPITGMYGMEIRSDQNNISGNIIKNCSGGIYNDGSFNTFWENIFRENDIVGLFVTGAESTHIAHNRFYGAGLDLIDSYHSTVEENLVNDKPLVVLEDTSDRLVTEAGQVLLINCQNITVRGANVSDTTIGVYLRNSQDCVIEDTIIDREKDIGILLEYSTNTTIAGNNLQGSAFGMLLGASLDNIIRSNEMTQNYDVGLYLSYSTDTTITENIFTDNAKWPVYPEFRGLMLASYSDDTRVTNNTFINDSAFVYGSYDNTFSNNTVNGYPLVYLEGATDRVIDEPLGQIILFECEQIDVHGRKNLTTTDVLVGLCVNCNISNISTPSRLNGMYLASSQGITISSSRIADDGYGIYMNSCSSCRIQGNIFTRNIYTGILLWSSTQTTIQGNAFIDNGGYAHQTFGGLCFVKSPDNEVLQNNFIDNARGQAFVSESMGNTFDGNFWDRPRSLPKLIWGSNLIPDIPRFAVDWHPAQEPYEIPQG